MGRTADRCGPRGTAGRTADSGLPPRKLTAGDFVLHSRRDALDDAESGARRHRSQGNSGRLLGGGENRDGAEGRPGDRRVFENKVYRLVRWIRSGKQSADRSGGDSGFGGGTASGWSGFSPGVPPRVATGARVSARSA